MYCVPQIPHEIGDFAILVQQGFSKRSAFLAQFVSAVGAFAGCGAGLILSGESPAWVLGFTAGGFIYISCADIIPELLETEEGEGLWQAVKEVVAICVGILMMVFIAKYEEVCEHGGASASSSPIAALCG